jgi:hypothetical protein
MTGDKAEQYLEQAFDRIEQAILPSLPAMLDSLLDAAALARPGHDAQSHAAQLRTFALDLDSLTRKLEAEARRQPYTARDYRSAFAA